MAKFVLKNASVTVNSVDLSNRVRRVTISTSADDVDVTAMGANGRQRLPGLKDESIEIEWNQDFALSNVDATLWPLYNAGSSFTCDIKPDSAAASSTNPRFTSTCYLLEYSPIDGEVGSGAAASTTFAVDGVITRATT